MKPRVLCLMQLPPPVHGASTINQLVASSPRLASQFTLEIHPLRFAASVDDISRVSVRKLATAVTTAARLIGAMALRRPDAVYFTVSPVGGAFYRDCVYIALIKAFGVPRVYHVHGKGIAMQLGSRSKRAVYRWAFHDAWVIHLSPLLVSETASIAAPGRVFCVPNGVPDDHVPPVAKDGVVRVLYLSNMIREKGPLVLLEALGMLAVRGLAVEASFAGSPFADGCADELAAGIRRLGLAQKVRYLGPVYGEAKAALFRTHDVFVLPTSYPNEAFPLVLLEAMKSGLPVISTFEGAIPEIVVDGETGFLVPGRDASALAGSLETLITDATRRRDMGARGRARYLEHYTVGSFEDNLATVLRECVGEKP